MHPVNPETEKFSIVQGNNFAINIEIQWLTSVGLLQTVFKENTLMFKENTIVFKENTK